MGRKQGNGNSTDGEGVPLPVSPQGMRPPLAVLSPRSWPRPFIMGP